MCGWAICVHLKWRNGLFWDILREIVEQPPPQRNIIQVSKVRLRYVYVFWVLRVWYVRNCVTLIQKPFILTWALTDSIVYGNFRSVAVYWMVFCVLGLFYIWIRFWILMHTQFLELFGLTTTCGMLSMVARASRWNGAWIDEHGCSFINKRLNW